MVLWTIVRVVKTAFGKCPSVCVLCSKMHSFSPKFFAEKQGNKMVKSSCFFGGALI